MKLIIKNRVLDTKTVTDKVADATAGVRNSAKNATKSILLTIGELGQKIQLPADYTAEQKKEQVKDSRIKDLKKQIRTLEAGPEKEQAPPAVQTADAS